MQAKTIRLMDYLESPLALGSAKGKEVKKQISTMVRKQRRQTHYLISMEGLKVIDSTFARDSIFSLIEQFKTKKSFILTDLPEDRIGVNLEYASRAKNQPAFAKVGEELNIIGGYFDKTSRAIIDHINLKKTLTSREIADHFEISIHTASNRMASLYESGCLFREQQTEKTGGVEYLYRSIVL